MNQPLAPLSSTPDLRTRILFVDDDENILRGLRNGLRRNRKVWDMHFANSGAEALEQCATTEFDVVVSDMRMPQMDGAELLTQIRDRHPGSSRMVLSGYADRSVVLRALPVSHQYLCKPCGPDRLTAIINDTVDRLSCVSQPEIRSLVGSLCSLPADDDVYMELVVELGKAQPDSQRIVTLINQDPALLIKCLQLANSAYFGAKGEVLTAREALEHLGIGLLAELANAGEIFAVAGQSDLCPAFSKQHRRRALKLARLSQHIAGEAHPEAYTMGLLAQIGQQVLAVHSCTEYSRLHGTRVSSSEQLATRERDQLGHDHAQVGAYLMGVWNLPESLTQAAHWYLEPCHTPPNVRTLVTAVHAADRILHDEDLHPAELAAQVERNAPTQLQGDLNQWQSYAQQLNR